MTPSGPRAGRLPILCTLALLLGACGDDDTNDATTTRPSPAAGEDASADPVPVPVSMPEAQDTPTDDGPIEPPPGVVDPPSPSAPDTTPEPGDTDAVDDPATTSDGAAPNDGVPDDPADAVPGDGGIRTVVLPAIDPNGPLPQIDGIYEDVWDGAGFVDPEGRDLLIDNLLIDNGAEAADGEVGYKWFGMHDGESLYLFVLFEGPESYTPFRDSARFFQDDALNLFFDGDGSRTERLDGVDDLYLAIPQLAAEGDAEPFAFLPFADDRNALPPSLVYAVCVCAPGGISAWELKIALSDLNVEVGRPFGFEVQIDQDLDGGDRDARWGWANPSIAERDATFSFESPRLNGSVVLAE